MHLSGWRRITLIFALIGIAVSACSFASLFANEPTPGFIIFLWFIHAPVTLLSWNFNISYAWIQGPLNIAYFACLGFVLGMIAEHSRRKWLYLSLMAVGLIAVHIASGFIIAVRVADTIQQLNGLTSIYDFLGR
ncbi:MAG: hypothetical protein PHE61_03255 [Candidatus Omnitrophica bacterium]|nr:hypothetical protein [Candidatus Omnitrophota bacterium]